MTKKSKIHLKEIDWKSMSDKDLERMIEFCQDALYYRRPEGKFALSPECQELRQLQVEIQDIEELMITMPLPQNIRVSFEWGVDQKAKLAEVVVSPAIEEESLSLDELKKNPEVETRKKEIDSKVKILRKKISVAAKKNGLTKQEILKTLW